MKKAFIILLTVFPCWLSAQTWCVMASAGKDHSVSSVSLEWTLGEIAIQQSHTGNMLLTQGYHQGDSPQLSSNIQVVDPMSSISVWPNPVYSKLNLFIPDELTGKVVFTMTDMNGKIVTLKVSYFGSQTVIDMNDLIQGVYFLRSENSVTHNASISKICKIN